MRLQLTATPEELEEKGPDLIKALAQRLDAYDPDLSDALIKAAKVRDPKSDLADDNLQFRVLREIKEQTTREYKRQLRGMLEDIGEVLDGRSLRKAFGDPPEEKEPGEDEDEEPLEPGDYDPKTDEIVPEPEEEEDEDEDEEKSVAPKTTEATTAG
jgi:hypothetical protein